MTADADLSGAGFWFPDNKFALPANIGLTDKGYILYYNAYEQGPYSLGPTRVFISYDELKAD